MRIAPEQICQVVSMLCEGVGIRAIQRLTGLNRRTVSSVLEQAGRHCESLMFRKVCKVTVENVAVDELWAFIYCKEANRDAFAHTHGDQYTFLAIDTKSKLIITYLVGKRNKDNAVLFMEDLKSKVTGRFQLSTDGFIPYISHSRKKGAVEMAFGNQIDYGTEIKKYAEDVDRERRYSAPPLESIRRIARLGCPDHNRINTSHAERQNLNVRLFSRRYTRLTLGYSKKLINHRHATSILVAFHNFCRTHSAHKQTPATAAGLTDRTWTVSELLQSI